MLLSKRLEKVIALAGQGKVAADIGTDHARVPIELVRRGRFEKVIASDVRPGPLEKARENIAEAQRGIGEAQKSSVEARSGSAEAGIPQGSIELRLGDGLKTLAPGEADVILICGMGGPLMERLLAESRPAVRVARQLILGPQSDVPHFRRFLRTQRLKVEEERLVEEEGKYYFLLRVQPLQKGESLPKEAPYELDYGGSLLQNNDLTLKSYLEKEKFQLSDVLRRIGTADSESAQQRRKEVRLRLRRCHQALKRYSS